MLSHPRRPPAAATAHTNLSNDPVSIPPAGAAIHCWQSQQIGRRQPPPLPLTLSHSVALHRRLRMLQVVQKWWVSVEQLIIFYRTNSYDTCYLDLYLQPQNRWPSTTHISSDSVWWVGRPNGLGSCSPAHLKTWVSVDFLVYRHGQPQFPPSRPPVPSLFVGACIYANLPTKR